MLATIGAIGGALGGLGQAAGGLAGLFGGGGGGTNWESVRIARENAERQYQIQKEFAQSGIQWRVADAKAAGLHPLAAIGAAPASYSPASYVGADTLPGASQDIGRSLAQMGQGIHRAANAASSKEDREAQAYNTTMRIENVRKAGLENQLLETQIEASKLALLRAGTGPGIPTGPSVASTPQGKFEIKPAEVTSSRPGQPHLEAGPAGPGSRHQQIGPAVVNMPSQGTQIDELSSPGWASYQFWNSVVPFFSQSARDRSRPDKSTLPKGANEWMWTPFGYVPSYPEKWGGKYSR